MTTFGAVPSNTDLLREVEIGLQDFRKGATAPTDATIGTTPTIGALLMDATNELLSVSVAIPEEWDRGDIELHLFFSLVNTQLNGDTLDMTCDYIAPRFVGGAGLTKTSTQITAQATAVTGRLAVAEPYKIAFIMDAADANNPFDANAEVLHAEFHLTNVTGIAAIHITGGHVKFTSTY